MVSGQFLIRLDPLEEGRSRGLGAAGSDCMTDDGWRGEGLAVVGRVKALGEARQRGGGALGRGELRGWTGVAGQRGGGDAAG